jgi:excinuclease UvrABC nuclease subunit
VRFRREIDNLRRRLQQYVEAEEYEKAAIVRDEIRRLEKAAAEVEIDDTGGDAEAKEKGGSGDGGEETV